MASKSSSSSSTRRTSTRKPRKKDPAAAAVETPVSADEASANDDLDFGAGIVEDESAGKASHAEPAPSRGRERREPRESAERKETVREEAPRERRPEASDVEENLIDIDDIELDDEDDASAPVAEGEERRPEGEDGDRRPRRRRRRRGRRGENQNPQQFNQGGQNRHQGGQGQNRRRDQQSQQRGGGGGGGGGNRNQQNSNRGRRVSKFEQNAAPSEPVATSGSIEGVLELHPKGYGFLRSADNDYGARETDAFVSSSFVEKHGLREGIKIKGEIGPGTRGQGPRLLSVDSIDGGSVEDYEKLKHFDTLTAINPFEQIKLEIGPRPVTMRVMDLLTPIGKGQRALIVAPPRTGKTMLLQDIANSVSKNHPEIHLIVLLIDERPEEVTEMRRTVRGEVIASSMDQDVESHVRISQLIIERGKRLAESGKDCFILLDSITRTARAFNKWVRGGRDSKIQTGGLDVRAMDIPRKMFGTARRFDEGGSLTVCATALIDTGSRMDDAIFQEFKGTGNMELVLSRDLADRRIWPAIDISKSGTRREEKILDPEILDGVIMLRRSLVSMNPTEAMDQLIRTLGKFDTNREFLQKIRAVL
jgi:transcription termination factor Rho